MTRRFSPGCKCCGTLSGVCVIHSDDFTTDLLGANWTIVSGTWAVAGGTLNCTAAGIIVNNGTITGTPPRSQLVFDLSILTESGQAAGGVIGYLNASNYYYVEAKKESSTTTTGRYHVRAFQVIGGVETQLGSVRADLEYAGIVLDEQNGKLYYGLGWFPQDYEVANVAGTGGTQAGFRVRTPGTPGVSFDNFGHGNQDFNSSHFDCIKPGCRLMGGGWAGSSGDPAWTFTVPTTWYLEADECIYNEGSGGEADATAIYAAGHPLDREDFIFRNVKFGRKYLTGDEWPTGTKQRFFFNAIDTSNYHAVEKQYYERPTPLGVEQAQQDIYTYKMRLLKVTAGTPTTLAETEHISGMGVAGNNDITSISLEYDSSTGKIEMIGDGSIQLKHNPPYLEATSTKHTNGYQFGYALLDRPGAGKHHEFIFSNVPELSEHRRHNAICQYTGCGVEIPVGQWGDMCHHKIAAAYYKVVISGLSGSGDCASDGANYDGTYILGKTFANDKWIAFTGIRCDVPYFDNPFTATWAQIELTFQGTNKIHVALKQPSEVWTGDAVAEHHVQWEKTFTGHHYCRDFVDEDLPHILSIGDLDGSSATCKITGLGTCDAQHLDIEGTAAIESDWEDIGV